MKISDLADDYVDLTDSSINDESAIHNQAPPNVISIPDDDQDESTERSELSSDQALESRHRFDSTEASYIDVEDDDSSSGIIKHEPKSCDSKDTEGEYLDNRGNKIEDLQGDIIALSKSTTSPKWERPKSPSPFFDEDYAAYIQLDDDGDVAIKPEEIDLGPKYRPSQDIKEEPELKEVLSEYTHNDGRLQHRLKVGKCVSIGAGTKLHDGTVLVTPQFLRIKQLFWRVRKQDPPDIKGIYVRGSLFSRNRECLGIVPLKAGELVCWRENVEVPVDSVERIRKLYITNLPFPEGRISVADAHDENTGLLIARWKTNMIYNQEGSSAASAVGDSGYFRRFTFEEADKEVRVEDHILTHNFRHFRDEGKRKRGPDGDLEGPVIKKPTPPPSPSKLARSLTRLNIEDNQPSSYTGVSDEPSSSVDGAEASFWRRYPTVLRSLYGNTANSTLSSSQSSSTTTNDPQLLSFTSNGRTNSRKIPSQSQRNNDDYTVISKDSFKSSLASPGQVLPESNTHQKRYVFADGFCGSGGVTRGAMQAGLKLGWGFDKDLKAITAYRNNFGYTKGHHIEAAAFANDFKENPGKYASPDILHLSPPCQTFSFAKTTPGKNDETNEASIFGIRELLDATRPRAVTLEQADGIIYIKSHVNHFFQILHQFTELGYSVKWQVLHALNYGVPTRRRRVIIIASCPGETLPDMPPPTHHNPWNKRLTNTTHLPPPATLGSAIFNIPRSATDQEYRPFDVPPGRIPDPNQPLLRTIIASGERSFDVHPNGLRRFTIRELACISTFPVDHQFEGGITDKRRQVGNAVPPKLAEAVLRSVIKHLREIDGGGLDVVIS